MPKLFHVVPIAALLFVRISAYAARAQTVDLPTVAAKTIEVKASRYGPVHNKTTAGDPVSDHFALAETEQIFVEKPGKVRIEAEENRPDFGKPLTDADHAARKSLYLTDGATQHRYFAGPNQFFYADTPPAAGFQTRFLTTVGLDCALGLNAPMLANYKLSGNDALDGKRFALYSYQHEAPINGRSVKRIHKFWVDPVTHLPVRYSLYNDSNGTMAEVVRFEFSGWKLNQPADESRFVWAAPPNAKGSKVR